MDGRSRRRPRSLPLLHAYVSHGSRRRHHEQSTGFRRISAHGKVGILPIARVDVCVEFLPEVQCLRPVKHRRTSAQIKVDRVCLPNLGKYMKFPRYVLLLKNITFTAPIPCSAHNASTMRNSFWKVHPLVDAFNDNRVRAIISRGKLVVDESMSEWGGEAMIHDLGPTGARM